MNLLFIKLLLLFSSVNGNVGEYITQGNIGTVDLTLEQLPVASVTVTPVFDATKITITPASITFTAGNYNVVQTFTITNITSGLEGIVSTPVTFNMSSSDEYYSNKSQSKTIKLFNNLYEDVLLSEVGNLHNRKKFDYENEDSWLIVRDSMIKELYSSGMLPTLSPDSIFLNTTPTLANFEPDVANYTKIDKYVCTYDLDSMVQYFHHIFPINPNGKIIFSSQGHASSYSESGNKTFIDEALANGYEVVYSALPLNLDNFSKHQNLPDVIGHRGFDNIEGNLADNGLAYFTQGWHRVSHYVSSEYNYTDKYAVGVSTGGVIAKYIALDTTISKTFEVSANFQDFVREELRQPALTVIGTEYAYYGDVYGDYEQGEFDTTEPSDFITNKFSYEDLSIINASGGRGLYQIYNIDDNCCIDKKREETYTDELEMFIRKNKNSNYGYLSTSYNQHGYSTESNNYIFLKMSN